MVMAVAIRSIFSAPRIWRYCSFQVLAANFGPIKGVGRLLHGVGGDKYRRA